MSKEKAIGLLTNEIGLLQRGLSYIQPPRGVDTLVRTIERLKKIRRVIHELNIQEDGK